MKRNAYSAGAVKYSFWFMEFRRVVELLSEGKSYEVIQQINAEQNLFGAPTTVRSEQICNAVIARLKCLPSSIYPVVLNGDVSTQKLCNLTAVLAHDTLFFDFVYEVFREKLIVGIDEFSDSDLNIFFKNKQLQDERAARWTDATLKRLGRCYKTMLYEAGLIDKGKSVRKIYRPIIDITLEDWLNYNGFGLIAKSLTGVR